VKPAHRFYLLPSQCHQPDLVLAGTDAHHALHVLRVKRGEPATVLDGAGQTFHCEVEQCGRDTVTLKVLERHLAPPPPWQITLLQAIPKGKLFESIIQKATELGVRRIVPLLSERVVTHIEEGKDALRKAAKWQLVAVEAIKQCGAPWLPRVEAPLTIPQFLARPESFDLPLLGSLQSDSKHPREYFRAFEQTHGRKPQTLCVWIGPEGDFSESEIAAIQSAGAKPITLGPLVLRTETAALYSLSIINYELHVPEAL